MTSTYLHKMSYLNIETILTPDITFWQTVCTYTLPIQNDKNYSVNLLTTDLETGEVYQNIGGVNLYEFYIVDDLS